jgi:apolipoprotein N-acyltransferase
MGETNARQPDMTTDASPKPSRRTRSARLATSLAPPWSQALAGGVLTTLTVPPVGWWPLAVPGIALLYSAVLRTDGRRAAFRLTALWALGLYVPSLWWMTAFSLPGGIFVGLLEASITGLTASVVLPRIRSGGHLRRRPRRHSSASSRLPRASRPATAAGLVGGLVFADALRSLWPFGGLPLGGIDLGQADGWFAPVVGWTGRLGLVSVVAGLGVVLVELLRAPRLTRPNRRLVSLLGAAGLLVLSPVAAVGTQERAGSPSGSDRTPREVLVVQGGGPRGLLASTENARRTFEAHVDATTAALDQLSDSVALILWPENTVDADTFATSDRYAQLQTLMRSIRPSGAYLSVGITEDGGPTEFLNAQVMIDPATRIVDRYDKVRRVPFGEYFPLRKQIESLGLADLPNRDARPGTEAGILRAGPSTFGVLISYEGFFDDRARNAVRAGAEVLLIPTNASSYKTTQLPSQQIAAAQLRALETNRDVFQAGPTGYSAFIRANGDIDQLTGLGTRETFIGTFTVRTNQTPYVRYNDAPMLALAGLLTASSIALRRKRPLISRDNAADG